MSTMPALAAARSPRVPAFGTVVRNQFKLIDTSRRAILLATVMAGGIILFLTGGWTASIDLRIVAMPPMIFAGMVWPLFIWQGETRTRRVYHRWLPVDHVAHDFAKIIAGAIYLVVLGIIIAGLVNLIAYVKLGPTHATTIPVVIAMVVGSLVAYLWTSLLPILSDKPLHWFVGFWPGLVALSFLSESYVPFVRDVLYVLLQADFGLSGAVAGAALLHVGPVRYSWGAVLVQWSVATILWTLIALGCLYLASVWANRKAEP